MLKGKIKKQEREEMETPMFLLLGSFVDEKDCSKVVTRYTWMEDLLSGCRVWEKMKGLCQDWFEMYVGISRLALYLHFKRKSVRLMQLLRVASIWQTFFTWIAIYLQVMLTHLKGCFAVWGSIFPGTPGYNLYMSAESPYIFHNFPTALFHAGLNTRDMKFGILQQMEPG